MKDKANSRIAFFFLLCILTPGIITATSRMRIWGSGDVVNPKELSANLLYLEDLILSRDGGGGASIPIADKETPGILNLGSQDLTKGTKTFYAENDKIADIAVEDFYQNISYQGLPVQNYWNGFSASKTQFCTEADAGGTCLVVLDSFTLLKSADGGGPVDLIGYYDYSGLIISKTANMDNDFGVSSSLTSQSNNDSGIYNLTIGVSDYVNLEYNANFSDGGHINNSISIDQHGVTINSEEKTRIFNASLETYATITDNTYMNNLKLQNRILIGSGSAYNMTDGGSGWFLASQYPLFTSSPMYGNYSIEYQAIVEDDEAISGNKFAVECLGANNEIILDRENTILNLLSTNMTYNSGGLYSIHWEIGSVAANSYTDGGYINCNLYYKSPEHVSSGPVTDEYLYKLTPIGF